MENDKKREMDLADRLGTIRILEFFLEDHVWMNGVLLAVDVGAWFLLCAIAEHTVGTVTVKSSIFEIILLSIFTFILEYIFAVVAILPEIIVELIISSIFPRYKK